MSFKIENHKEITQVRTFQDTTLGIMKWGQDNSYPQTLINLINQSPTAKPAVDRTAKFIKGSSFEGENQIVNATGVTLRQVVDICADDMAIFEAFVIQCNYDVNGRVAGINPMRIEDFRFNEFDELNFASRVGYYYNYGRNDEVQKTIDMTATKGKIKWFDRFNPDVVIDQIKATKGGLSNYKGQVLYHSMSGHSSYPIPKLQAPINYVLSDVENSILVRKETSTGFINSYLMKTTMSADDANLEKLESAIAEAQGARGSGKIITMSDMDPESIQATVLEEIGGGAGTAGAIIDAATVAYELNHKVLTGAYMLPPILAGGNQSNGFTGVDLKDAYFVFNAITRNPRDIIEQQINRILKNSIFDVQSIKLNKLSLDEEAGLSTNDTSEEGEGSLLDAIKKQMAVVMKNGRSFTDADLELVALKYKMARRDA